MIARAGLHPLLALVGVQAPAGGVLPETSLPVSLFVPPSVLGPLQAARGALERAWRDLVRASVARGRVPDPGLARPILEAIARALVERDPALARAATLSDEPFAFVPRAPLQTDRIAYPLVALRVDRGRDAAAPGTTLALGDDPTALAQCGRLLGLITAGEPLPSVLRYLAEAPAALALLGHLTAGEWIVAAPARPRFADLAPGTIVHLGHAGLLANLGGRFVLVDPWLPPAAEGDAPPPPAAAELPRLDAILLTHHHFDHAHVETLLQLDKRVPVYLPAQPAGRLLSPRTDALLAWLGFADVRPLAHGESFPVGDGGRVTAAPFFGEDPLRIGFVGNAWVLGHLGAAALATADSATDGEGRSLVTSGAARALRARFGALSPVFATRRQELGTMIEYGWEALLRPSREWVLPTENACNDAAALAALAFQAGARCLALYSEGGARWYPEWTNFVAAEASPQHRPFQFLWDDLAAIERAVRAVGADVVLARPYQRFRIGGGADGEVAPRPSPSAY